MTKQKNTSANGNDDQGTVAFTSYQLAFLAAVNDGANTAVEIREVLLDETEGQEGASARRKTYETIESMEAFGYVVTEKVGVLRFVDLTANGYADVSEALTAAGLA